MENSAKKDPYTEPIQGEDLAGTNTVVALNGLVTPMEPQLVNRARSEIDSFGLTGEIQTHLSFDLDETLSTFVVDRQTPPLRRA